MELRSIDVGVLCCIREGVNHLYAITKHLRQNSEIKSSIYLAAVNRSLDRLGSQGFITALERGDRNTIPYKLTALGETYADIDLLRYIEFMVGKTPKIKAEGIPLGGTIQLPPPEEISRRAGVPLHKVKRYEEEMKGAKVDGVFGAVKVGQVTAPIVDPEFEKPEENHKKEDISNALPFGPTRGASGRGLLIPAAVIVGLIGLGLFAWWRRRQSLFSKPVCGYIQGPIECDEYGRSS